MKIEARCDTCARTFLLSQIGSGSDAPGRCPFCGAHFGRHYSTVLVPAVNAAEAAAVAFVSALERLQAMETGFDIDAEGLLKELEDRIRANEPRKV
jgi:hypothetical protein